MDRWTNNKHTNKQIDKSTINHNQKQTFKHSNIQMNK